MNTVDTSSQHELENMELNDVIELSDNNVLKQKGIYCYVHKVSGGWIYIHADRDGFTSTFVPNPTTYKTYDNRPNHIGLG